MNEKTSALFRAHYVIETLFEVKFISLMGDGTLLTFALHKALQQ